MTASRGEEEKGAGGQPQNAALRLALNELQSPVQTRLSTRLDSAAMLS